MVKIDKVQNRIINKWLERIAINLIGTALKIKRMPIIRGYYMLLVLNLNRKFAGYDSEFGGISSEDRDERAIKLWIVIINPGKRYSSAYSGINVIWL